MEEQSKGASQQPDNDMCPSYSQPINYVALTKVKEAEKFNLSTLVNYCPLNHSHLNLLSPFILLLPDLGRFYWYHACRAVRKSLVRLARARPTWLKQSLNTVYWIEAHYPGRVLTLVSPPSLLCVNIQKS